MADAVKNLALDKDVRKRVVDELVPLLTTVRDDRVRLREKWMRYYRIWSVTHDQQGYKGRTNTYIPAGRRWIENWTRRVRRDLFPDADWFDVRARHRDSEPRAAGVKALLQYFFRHQMRLTRMATPWCRQLVTYGTSPARVVWRLDERKAKTLRAADEDLRGGASPAKVEPKIATVLDYIGPTFRPVDLFAFYVWPTTCLDVDDAELAFEDLLVSRDRVKQMADTKLPGGDPLYAHTEQLFATLDEAAAQRSATSSGTASGIRDKFEAAARRLADKGFTHPLDAKLPAEQRPVDITECRWVMDLEDDGAKPYLVAIGHDDVVLRVQEEPFWHGDSWWLAGKFVEVLHEFYGRGLPEVFDHMQYLTNDLMNQTSDALTWSLNPIVVMDMARVQDPGSLRNVPGAKWLADPAGVQFSQPAQGPAQAGQAAVSQILGLADSFSNATPAGALGAAQRGRSRSQQTAAGTQLILAENAVDIREVVETNSEMVFERLAKRSWQLAQQFLDRDLVLKVASIDGAALIQTPIGVADLVGDFDFEWMAALNSAQSGAIRAQQANNFLGMAIKIPPDQLAAKGIEIDWKYLLRSAYGPAGLGNRDAEKVVRDTVKQDAMDPRLENDLFRVGRGGEIRVSTKEDGAQHIRTHELLLREPLDWTTQQQLQAHIQEHVQAMVAAEVQRLMQEQQQLAGPMGAPGGNGAGPAAVGNGPGGRAAPPVGPGRLAQTAGVDDVMRGLPRGDVM